MRLLAIPNCLSCTWIVHPSPNPRSLGRSARGRTSSHRSRTPTDQSSNRGGRKGDFKKRSNDCPLSTLLLWRCLKHTTHRRPRRKTSRFLAIRISQIYRIISNISVEIELVVIADGIDLHEPPERRRVDPSFVMIHAQLRQPDLAGILEPARIARRRDAIFIIAVDRRYARAAGPRDDRALVVGMQVADAAGPAPLIGEHRHVGPDIMGVALRHRAGGVILRDQIIAVVEEPPVRARALHPVEPPQRI